MALTDEALREREAVVKWLRDSNAQSRLALDRMSPGYDRTLARLLQTNWEAIANCIERGEHLVVAE